MRHRRVVKWLAWSGVAVIVVLALCALALKRALHSDILKDRIVAEMSRQLQSDVTLDALQIDVMPVLRLVGHGLTVSRRGTDRARTITVETFVVEPGVRNLYHGRASFVQVEGLRITVPPSDSVHQAMRMVQTLAAPEAEPPSSARIDHLVAKRLEIVFLRHDSVHDPRVYEIHNFSIDAVSGKTRMPFSVELTNPKPDGLIKATGVLGPWNGPSPAESPITGSFVYTDADFDSINGLGGTLSAKGTFAGVLADLSVAGTTDTPDFQLDRGGHNLHLATAFRATVDGTNGDTVLDSVDGTLAHSRILAKGKVVGTPNHGGKLIDLDVSVPSGRIEDFLTLILPAAQPLIRGAMTMSSRLTLPPGHNHAVERLFLDGKFAISQATFVSEDIQSKVDEFSRRGRGLSANDKPSGTRADLRGVFRMQAASLALSALQFVVPGARVSVSGTYGLNPPTLDMTGRLQLDAPMSRAVGGVKGFLLTAVDPLFKTQGAGTEIPIRVTGTQDHPKIAVDFDKVFHRK